MAARAPIVFLAFANELDDHLKMLKAESRDVFRALQPLQDAGSIAVHREESSELDELYRDMLRFGDRVVIFHYGGHASGTKLRLEGGRAGAGGLARLLGEQNGLKLVFLNGCATRGHVSLLLDAGVPAVIATSVPIGDSKAKAFATAFYLALAEGRSIAASFRTASAFVESEAGAGNAPGVDFSRNTEWEDEADAAGDAVDEWGLYSRKEHAPDLETWRLPDAAADWVHELVDAQGPLRDQQGEPVLVQQRSRIRTISAIRCHACGTRSATAATERPECPVCGTDDPDFDSARTAIADQLVPFSVSEEDARKLATEVAGAGTTVTRARQLFVPFWVFDVDTRTTFDAERGLQRDFTQAVPRLEWEPVKGEFDLGFESMLVPAGAAPTGSDDGSGDWYWELDAAQPADHPADAGSSVVLDRPIQSAFDVLSARLAEDRDAEIAERTGGHRQRNISADTRYRKLEARTVLLPHWYLTVAATSGPAGLVVNGQTGAVRPVSLPGMDKLRLGGRPGMNKRSYESGTQPAKTSISISIFSGAGIGLMVGALLGLAMSPTVAAFVGAIGAVLAALLGLNDRHFGASKGLRIGMFGLFAILGAAAGLAAKNHGIFAPSLMERKATYLELGYTECQALDLLAGLSLRLQHPGSDVGLIERKKELLAAGYSECQALQLLAGPPDAVAATDGSAGGDTARSQVSPIDAAVLGAGLMASGVEVSSCTNLRSLRYPPTRPLADVRRAFDAAGPGWASFTNALFAADLGEQDKLELLFIARHAACLSGELPSKAHCARLRAAAAESDAALQTAFGEVPALEPVRELVNERMSSAAGRSTVARLLTGALCHDDV